MEPISAFSTAVLNGDVDKAQAVIEAHPTIVRDAGLTMDSYLEDAIDRDDPQMLELLVRLGADINTPWSVNYPDGHLDLAAMGGHIKCVQWMLANGAEINTEEQGVSRCSALASASFKGYLEIATLLVEHGATLNYVWNNNNPLSLALKCGHSDVVTYLRSKGAKLPSELSKESAAKPELGASMVVPSAIVEHVKRHFGDPEPLVIGEILADTPTIRIHTVRANDCVALITEGVSSKPLTVPPGGEKLQFAELLMFLPSEWRLDREALADPNYSWPIEWLRRLALYPHHNLTWFGVSAVFDNEEPPAPIAPNTAMSCFLVIQAPEQFGTMLRDDGSPVIFYHVIPIYEEERDLERQCGIGNLLNRFQKYGVSRIIDVKRRNVAVDTTESTGIER